MKNKLATAGFTALGMLISSPVLAQVNTSITVNGYGTNTPEDIVINLINWILGILAIIAVIMVLIGGFRWMTAGGNEEKVDSAKKLLIAAVIGLVIVMAAWGISIYAVGILAGATGAQVI
ncbi:MAG: pilin [Candidatus Kerfeldbacteria bacterium]